MASREGRIYRRGSNALKITLRVLAVIVVLAAALYVALFFHFKRYITYTPEDTIEVVVPWLEEETPEK